MALQQQIVFYIKIKCDENAPCLMPGAFFVQKHNGKYNMENSEEFNKLDLSQVDPNHNTASLLFNCISHKIIDSLLHLIEVYEDYFKVELNEIKEKIRHSLKEKPNPKLFFFHHALKSSIESQDPDYATAVIKHFESYSIKDFSVDTSKKISFINLDDEEWVLECAKISAEIDSRKLPHGETEKIFLDEIRKITEDVLLIIDKHHSELHNEILVYVNTVFLSCNEKLIGPLGYPLVGGTSVSYHGALFMQIPSDYIFFKELILEHLVHEAAHIHINSILATNPLVLNDISELYPSSVRKDPRPIIGIYHTMFVLCRVLMAFDACRVDLNDEYISKQYAAIQEQFNKAFLTCEKNAKLTALGLDILENCRKYFR